MTFGTYVRVDIIRILTFIHIAVTFYNKIDNNIKACTPIKLK